MIRRRAGRIRTTTNDGGRAELVLRTSALASAGYAPYSRKEKRWGRRRRGRRSMLETAALKPKSLHERISPTILMSAVCSALSSNGKAERANGSDSVQARACISPIITSDSSTHHAFPWQCPTIKSPYTEVFFFFMCEDGIHTRIWACASPAAPAFPLPVRKAGEHMVHEVAGGVTSTLPTQAHTALPPIQYIYSPFASSSTPLTFSCDRAIRPGPCRKCTELINSGRPYMVICYATPVNGMGPSAAASRQPSFSGRTD